MIFVPCRWPFLTPPPIPILPFRSVVCPLTHLLFRNEEIVMLRSLGSMIFVQNCMRNRKGEARCFSSHLVYLIYYLFCRRLPFEDKIRLLDVGSCYNPFLQFSEFMAIGIDISPAHEVCEATLVYLQSVSGVSYLGHPSPSLLRVMIFVCVFVWHCNHRTCHVRNA